MPWDSELFLFVVLMKAFHEKKRKRLSSCLLEAFCVGAPVLRLRGSLCGCFNETGMHRLLCLNNWFSVELFGKGGEVCDLGTEVSEARVTEFS